VDFVRALAPYAALASIASLLRVLVPHVGIVSGGARRWIGAGGFAFEPSEFAKLALIIYLAATISRRSAYWPNTSETMTRHNSRARSTGLNHGTMRGYFARSASEGGGVTVTLNLPMRVLEPR